MSMGYGGSARIVDQDSKTAIYEYAPYNLDEPAFRNGNRIHDGLITINKESLVEPEIHEKVKRMPSGRKRLIIKRIRRDVDYSSLLKEKKIMVENSRYCWRYVGTEKNIGMIAMKLIFHIYDQYQMEGALPKTVSLNY